MDILLVEPGYRNKYPPIGLMKLSQYHKGKGDCVEFVKGISEEKRDKSWDRIYISSLFTYDWAETIKAIKYYRFSVKGQPSNDLIVGGVLGSLLGDDIIEEVNCKVVKGLLDSNGKLGFEDDGVIDSMVPDYSILDEIEYKYPTSNAYIGYSTKGCIRKCKFCAVPKIEPAFKNYLPISEQIDSIREKYGPKRDLLLLDNNVLASSEFEKIIDQIRVRGFERGAKFVYKNRNGQEVKVQRIVDFNQGIDARLLDEKKMELLSTIAIRPLRIAFDNIAYAELYKRKVRLACKYGIKHLSNYVLYNYLDKPGEFYERLRINVELNEELGVQIYSFPMRYIDLGSKSRSTSIKKNVGKHWNKKYLRAIQCVLNATKGIVGVKKGFFQRAFGKDIDEYRKILLMPEEFILKRNEHRDDGSTELWWDLYNGLDMHEKEIFSSLVVRRDEYQTDGRELSEALFKVLSYY